MLRVAVQIVRFVDESQPGFVECELKDAHGRTSTFVARMPFVTLENLDWESAYPQAGEMECDEIASRRDGQGREVVTVEILAAPNVDSFLQEMTFEVFAQSLIDR
jgi:hypothetical protein